MKFKNYIKILKGEKIESKFITNNSEGNIPYICASDIKMKQCIDLPKVKYYITHNIAKFLNLDLARKGDILFVKSGETHGHICLIHTKGVEAYYNSDEIFCIRTRKTAIPRFMCFVIGKYAKRTKSEAYAEEKDPLFTPENMLQSKVPFYTLEKQNKILSFIQSLIKKEQKANLMIDDIMQDLVYMYRSYFDDDTSKKVTIGSTLERYLRYNEKTPDETETYKICNIWKDLKVTDEQTFDDLYHFVKSDTPLFTEDFPIHKDCVYISIDGSDIGECGLYHKDLFNKSIYFALTPTEKYPALYLYFILSFHSCLTKSEETNNKLVILPSSIEHYPLSTDYDRIAQFSQAVEEPINDINDLIKDISNMKELRLSILKEAFENEVQIMPLKKEINKYRMYR